MRFLLRRMREIRVGTIGCRLPEIMMFDPRTIFARGPDLRLIVARFALALTLILMAPASLSQEVAPDALLRSVTQEVIGQIKRDAQLRSGDPVKVAALVQAKVLPLFDFNRMTQIAMGSNWRLASPAQQLALVTEFKKLLVRTYSAALMKYRDEVIEVRPLRVAQGDAEATVKCDVKRTGKEQMSLDYDMEKTPAGWRIYNIRVAGVSLVLTYREFFAEKIRAGGVEGLIKSLSDMNRKGDSRFNSMKASVWEKFRLMHAIFQGMMQRLQ